MNEQRPNPAPIPKETLRCSRNVRGIPARARPKPKLGPLLRKAREAAGLSVRQAAAESGISLGAISLLEQGKTPSTRIDRLLALTETYGVEPLEIIEAAGYDLTPALPTFTPYLRSKYRHLPPAAHDEIAAAFHRIASKYGIDEHSSGPVGGQDEQPEPAGHSGQRE